MTLCYLECQILTILTQGSSMDGTVSLQVSVGGRNAAQSAGIFSKDGEFDVLSVEIFLPALLG